MSCCWMKASSFRLPVWRSILRARCMWEECLILDSSCALLNDCKKKKGTSANLPFVFQPFLSHQLVYLNYVVY